MSLNVVRVWERLAQGDDWTRIGEILLDLSDYFSLAQLSIFLSHLRWRAFHARLYRPTQLSNRPNDAIPLQWSHTRQGRTMKEKRQRLRLTAFQEVEDNLAVLRILEGRRSNGERLRHLRKSRFNSLPIGTNVASTTISKSSRRKWSCYQISATISTFRVDEWVPVFGWSKPSAVAGMHRSFRNSNERAQAETLARSQRSLSQ
jgi:hypothetical protein